jgi:hypothetical protein
LRLASVVLGKSLFTPRHSGCFQYCQIETPKRRKTVIEPKNIGFVKGDKRALKKERDKEFFLDKDIAKAEAEGAVLDRTY